MANSNSEANANSGKKFPTFLIFLIPILLIGGYLIANSIATQTNAIQFGRSEHGYGLYYIGNTEVEAILNESRERYFIYVGTPTCPVCQQFEPVLQTTLEYLGQELRYFNIDLAGSDEASVEALNLNLAILGVAHVPTLVYIQNGVVLDSIVGSQEKETIIEFFEANGGLN